MSKKRILQEFYPEAKRLAARGYVDFAVKQGEFWIARDTTMPNCMAQGNTGDEAIAALREVRVAYIACMLMYGLPVPPPDVKYQTTAHVTTMTLRINYEAML